MFGFSRNLPLLCGLDLILQALQLSFNFTHFNVRSDVPSYSLRRTELTKTPPHSCTAENNTKCDLWNAVCVVFVNANYQKLLRCGPFSRAQIGGSAQLISSGLIYVHLLPVADPGESNLNSCLIFRAFGEESRQ